MTILISLWLTCGVVAAVIGGQKGDAMGGFMLGFILGPLGIVIALVMRGNRKECPFCRERIHPDAVVCPRCQRDQPTSAPIAAAPNARPVVAHASDQNRDLKAAAAIIVIIGVLAMVFFTGFRPK